MSRTLEEAIEKYKRDEKAYRILAHHNNSSYVPKKIADEYKQLAEWLRELQERREAPEIVRCGECEHFRQEPDGEMWCGVSKGHGIDKDFFCGDAERRTE